MTGEDGGEDADYDRARVPAALRDRITELFVQYRGYEPATFQESLSLVADLAAAQVEAEGAVPPDAEGAAGAAADEPGHDDAVAAAGTGAPPDDAVTDLSAEVVDDATDRTFGELRQDGRAPAGPANDEDATAVDDAPGDGSFPETLRADPESNCALCGDVHPVSVLETTIPDETDSIALVCPSCAE